MINLTSGLGDNYLIEKEVILAPQGSLHEIAQKLYAKMYELDAMDLDLILIEFTPGEGIGKAINDRLKRSSTP